MIRNDTESDTDDKKTEMAQTLAITRDSSKDILLTIPFGATLIYAHKNKICVYLTYESQIEPYY